MDLKTLNRCGFVWMLFALFLIDGGNFICADERRAEKENQDAAELTSEIVDSVAKNQPDWFVADGVYSDDLGILNVETRTAYLNATQAEQELGQECIQAINGVLDRWFGDGAGQEIQINQDYVFQNLIHDNRKIIQPHGTEFFNGYAQLHLDDEFRDHAQSLWQQVQTRQRIIGGGLIGGSVLALLVVMLGYLKMETATRGFYSRRLQTVFVIVAVAVIAAAFWFSQSISW